MKREKEVLALLSRLDLENVKFTDSIPGAFPAKFTYLVFSPSSLWPWAW